MHLIEILSPVPPTRTARRTLAARLDGLASRRIAWFDNQKANAAALLAALAAALRDQGCTFESVVLDKNATAAAPPDVMAHLKSCDAVILAIAD